MSFRRDIRTIPNLITLTRIGLVIAGAVLFFSGWKGVAIVLGVVAGLSDYADGMVARRTGQVTRLGEIFDQFSDLCFESLVLLFVVSEGFLPVLCLYIYLVREFWVMAIRRYMAGERMNIPSTIWGKLKSNFILWGMLPTFLSLLGALPALEPYLGHLGRFGICLGLLFGYISGWKYTRVFIAGYGQTRVD